MSTINIKESCPNCNHQTFYIIGKMYHDYYLCDGCGKTFRYWELNYNQETLAFSWS